MLIGAALFLGCEGKVGAEGNRHTEPGYGRGYRPSYTAILGVSLPGCK